MKDAKALEVVKQRSQAGKLPKSGTEVCYSHVENDRLTLSWLHTAKVEGEAFGRYKAANKIALKLIARGEPDEAIAELTELSLAEVRALRKQQAL